MHNNNTTSIHHIPLPFKMMSEQSREQHSNLHGSNNKSVKSVKSVKDGNGQGRPVSLWIALS